MSESQTIFKKIFASHGKELMCLQSDIDSKNTVQIRPLFLYHTRRTSGVAFFFALRSAMDCMFKVAGQKKETMPLMHRVESDILPPDYVLQDFSLIGSHANFGLHKQFSQNFILTTIVREPYTRLGSTYMSACMRSQIKPEISQFKKFISNPENQNCTVRQLCGLSIDQEVEARHLDEAVNTLIEHFDSYVTNAQTNDLITYYLSYFGLCNVVMNRPNRTRNDYKIDTSPFKDFILEQNELDLKLFEFVAENSKIPLLDGSQVRYSPQTFIGYEDEKLVESGMIGICMPTDNFCTIVEDHPEVLENLKLFWDFVDLSS